MPLISHLKKQTSFSLSTEGKIKINPALEHRPAWRSGLLKTKRNEIEGLKQAEAERLIVVWEADVIIYAK